MAAPPVVQYTHASIAERRIMRKNAIPEHAYTGYVGCIHPDNDFAFFRYVPKDTREQPDDPKPVVGKIKHAIVGYRGHRHNKEAMIGTTFTRGLEIVPQPVRLRKPYAMPQANKQLPISASGYGGFDKLSGYGQFLSRSQAGRQVADASGYGEMDNETQYGQFAAPPRPHDDVRSTYGEFAQASKYGQFAPPPSASGYGKFEKMSGYGQFAPPAAESGYGKFEKMSGYGQFAPPPAASEYGKFEKMSGYGQFAPPPSASEYGKFEKMSGYGQFAPPPAASEYGKFEKMRYGGFDKLSGYGQFLSRSQAGRQVADASGYGEMDNETQYGQFAAPPRPHDDVRSTYGEFAQASKYGQFAPPPSASGYGKFEKMSGYGQFAPPAAESGYGKFEKMSGYGQFAPPPAASEYGKFQDTSNYGQFAPQPPSNNAENASGHRQGAAALPNKPIPQDRTRDRGKAETIPTSHVRPENPPHDQLTDPHKPPLRAPRPPLNEIQFDDLCRNEGLRDAYIRVLRRVGGAPVVASLFQRISNVLRQQKGSKTETKQRVKVAFDLVVSRGLNII
ncbi:hypothetical protein H257_04394 [Aphanomyces astaci]|uniref:Uncharacterized protein n=1 Tax=Aphanomyces astaci TaxID=112090 RepID=W4GVL8_APHAT|nr:hypothetical protein H257_04394 [Aphanomyces astaci]ETV83765.1 hypothetical protein H257_04394 [Aphanomyces astaci]|eukprot:XP_009827195.1 hypothetical protein H257_04394 [Aphanomyces astaci]